MRFVPAFLVAAMAAGLGACAVVGTAVGVTGTVVGTAAGVAGTVVSTTAARSGDAIGAAARAAGAISSSRDSE
jgi:hypothetical protein